MEESSATLEETNKMRIELGIMPLGGLAAGGEAGEDAVPDKDQEAEENWNRRKQEEADQAKTKYVHPRPPLPCLPWPCLPSPSPCFPFSFTERLSSFGSTIRANEECIAK
jgi:hypothetical protein